jgi:hypothetical protein
MQHLITLVIETEPGERNPDRWNWSEILDTPLPVTVVACTPLPDEPTEAEVQRLHAGMRLSHDVVRAR